MTPPRSETLARALAPLSALWGLVVARRNRRFDRGEGVHRAAVPVVSVGNLAVGGTGKTPMTAWLAARLAARGRRSAIVTRGYGGRAGVGPLDVSRGGGPLVDAAVGGDEPVLLARLTSAVVVAGSDRVAGARRAVELGADVVILDDGFQHRRLDRDLDVVLLDAASPFGNGRLLPAGPLREPPSSLARAGIVVLTRWSGEAPPAGIAAPVVRARHRNAGFRDAAGREVPAPGRAFAFCGIARPASFLDSLRGAGVEIAGTRAFPDHHRFDAADLRALADGARERGAAIVTTMKDLVRLSGALPDVIALHVELDVVDPDPLEAALDAVTGRWR
ncbi:MAG TPA: tetraacyldisaccharide 4'-kinase [Candidatus Polarisedimenticolaceae bacterium]